MSLAEIVEGIGGGTASGRPVKAVQVGGPLGAYFPPALFDTPFGYEDYAGKGGLIGHAGIVVFDDTADMLKQARFAMEFCAIESCGKCTPCRIGTHQAHDILVAITEGRGQLSDLDELLHLADGMRDLSNCGLGQTSGVPIFDTLKYFRAEVEAHIRLGLCPTGVCPMQPETIPAETELVAQ
jgi:formate dehydrogenase iron-sulfur subunit